MNKDFVHFVPAKTNRGNFFSIYRSIGAQMKAIEWWFIAVGAAGAATVVLLLFFSTLGLNFNRCITCTIDVAFLYQLPRPSIQIGWKTENCEKVALCIVMKKKKWEGMMNKQNENLLEKKQRTRAQKQTEKLCIERFQWISFLLNRPIAICDSVTGFYGDQSTLLSSRQMQRKKKKKIEKNQHHTVPPHTDPWSTRAHTHSHVQAYIA